MVKSDETKENLVKEFDINQINKPLKINSPDFESILKEIKRDEYKRRNASTKENPYYAMELIRESGLGAIQLPAEFGGSNASIRDLLYAVIRLAEADPDVAHILRFHYSFVERILRESGNEKNNNKLLKKIASGAIVGNAFAEINHRRVASL